MKNLKNSIISILFILLLSLFMGCASAPSTTENPTVANFKTYTPAENWDKVHDGTILQCWCWSFNTIKENLPDIAKAGFSAIQTSPIQACCEGDNKGMDLMSQMTGKWWYHYQPTAWKIGNYQLGNRDEFKAMCEEAEKYGISVIVDVIPNHTTSNKQVILPEFIEAVGGMDKLYHENGDNFITNWNDRYEVVTGKMGGLPDVNTENPLFQEYFMDYVNDVVLCGADGFRYDTAKHIGLPDDPKDKYATENDFWPIFTGKKAINGKMLSRADELFIYGEILEGNTAREDAYTEFINITASEYGNRIRDGLVFNELKASRMEEMYSKGDNDKLVTWVESHDTYANQGKSAKLSNFKLRAGWAVIAARQKGTPLFFSRPQGPEATQFPGVSKIGDKGNDEFMHPEVAAVNNFRKAMVGESEEFINGSSLATLIIKRGEKGFVIINMKDENEPISIPTQLPEGKYKDHAHGLKFTVKEGLLQGKVKPNQIAVIY